MKKFDSVHFGVI